MYVHRIETNMLIRIDNLILFDMDPCVHPLHLLIGALTTSHCMLVLMGRKGRSDHEQYGTFAGQYHDMRTVAGIQVIASVLCSHQLSAGSYSGSLTLIYTAPVSSYECQSQTKTTVLGITCMCYLETCYLAEYAIQCSHMVYMSHPAKSLKSDG